MITRPSSGKRLAGIAAGWLWLAALGNPQADHGGAGIPAPAPAVAPSNGVAPPPDPRVVRCDRTYRPGSFLKAKDYPTLSRYLQEHVVGEAAPAVKARDMHEWNTVEAAEVTAAALAVLREPEKADVEFGSYSDPAGRESTEIAAGPDGGEGDGGAGLRIVFQREFGSQLVSIITFWRIDTQTMQLEQMTGPDAMRVRVELAPYHGPEAPTWIGLSYNLHRGANGKIDRADPLEYFDPRTGEKAFQPAVKVGPQSCQSCHSHRERRDQIDPNDEAADIPAGVTEMLNDARIALAVTQGGSPADPHRLDAIATELKALHRKSGPADLKGHRPDPRVVPLLVAKSLVRVLQADCDRYRQRKDLADELASFENGGDH